MEDIEAIRHRIASLPTTIPTVPNILLSSSSSSSLYLSQLESHIHTQNQEIANQCLHSLENIQLRMKTFVQGIQDIKNQCQDASQQGQDGPFKEYESLLTQR